MKKTLLSLFAVLSLGVSSLFAVNYDAPSSANVGENFTIYAGYDFSAPLYFEMELWVQEPGGEMRYWSYLGWGWSSVDGSALFSGWQPGEYNFEIRSYYYGGVNYWQPTTYVETTSFSVTVN